MKKTVFFLYLIFSLSSGTACVVKDMIQTINNEIPTYESSKESLKLIKNCYDYHNSYMALFPSIYLLVTDEFEIKIMEEDFYQDKMWMKKMIVEFYMLYRNALVSYETKQFGNVPRSWMLAFNETKKDRPSALRVLVFSMHAHINRDLPIAINNTGLDIAKCDNCYDDYFKTNLVFEEILPDLWWILKDFDPDVNGTNRPVSFFSLNIIKAIKKYRKRAWNLALNMQNKKEVTIQKIDFLADIYLKSFFMVPKRFTKTSSIFLKFLFP